MGWLLDRLTVRRLVVIGVLFAVAIGVIVIGDPFAHPGTGSQTDGARGVGGIPRIVEVVALVIAFVIAWPPRGEGEGDGG